MNTIDKIQDEIRELVQSSFPLAKSHSALHDNSLLLDMGIIDSMGILDLLVQLEDAFGISYSDQDLLPENFESIAAMAKCVHAKQLAVLE